MNIAIDFDHTYTRIPEILDTFINMCLKAGHKCYIVSMRAPEEKHIIENALITKIPIICCNHTFKRKVCAQRGVYVDVWIDDTPAGVDDQRLMLAYDDNGAPCTVWQWLDKAVTPDL